MNNNRNAFMRTYRAHILLSAFGVVLLVILWPLNSTRVGYILLLGGVGSLLTIPIVPQGLTKIGWTTKDQRRNLLISGISAIVIGLLFLRFK